MKIWDICKVTLKMQWDGLVGMIGCEIAKGLKKAKEKDLQCGDTVKLRSGGPEMTITKTDNSAGGIMATCTWFSGPQVMEKEFCAESLERVCPHSSNFLSSNTTETKNC